ncbi:hypothetical protein QBC46DRAFT_441949 [Diplogelasinospora grovesii]|uniref:Uncharacterized protein n=1 Tax=Diplogelasinospora grovesii TaxID=303347 RepID=A0AAN6NEC9_9PEZI|nr:hypothetical protein QBC46DRAFT_441949 [Diplogelasinospora grovesii]
MAPKPSWILKTPRVFLILLFPLVNFILYLILSLGCFSDSLSLVSPIVVHTDNSVPVGGENTRIDLRIGFWGICFGPDPYKCTSSVSVFPTKTETDIANAITPDRGGGNVALAGLALALQSNFAILSGIVLLILLFGSVMANVVQIYFNTQAMREEHIKAAIWARSLDWGAAAAAVAGFSSYQSLVGVTPALIQAATGDQDLKVNAGMIASNLFAAIVGLTIAGALVNTFLTAMDAGLDAYSAEKYRTRPPPPLARTKTGSSVGETEIGDDRLRDEAFRPRAAYEAFP